MAPGAIRTLIVDDEPIARQILREELAGFPDVTVVGEAENGQDALNKIGKLDPDLVFLDLQMPAARIRPASLFDGPEVSLDAQVRDSTPRLA